MVSPEPERLKIRLMPPSLLQRLKEHKLVQWALAFSG